MNKFEKEQIKGAFTMCFGLKEAFGKAMISSNKNYKTEAISSLAFQSGFRTDFIKNNVEEILKL